MRIAALALLLTGLTSVAFAGFVGNGPEVDGGVAAGAFVLIGGAVLIIRSRLRRQ
ncbi:MAG TPA: hypothetical protein VML19_12430 [Verrucomicrobiae bacterium]|nr:hypothetical protein [Verrucomicrobiae bacterium]